MRKWFLGGGIVLVAAAFLGALAGVGLFTVKEAKALSYLSSDPKACVNCHIMREVYDDWAKGKHHHVAVCVDCHLPHDFVGKYMTKIEHGWNHSKAFTLQNFHEPIQIGKKSLSVVEHNCVNCHVSIVSNISEARASFSSAHENAGARLGEAEGCVHCHRGVGHGQ